MAIVKAYVDKLGGEIQVESEFGKGTVMTVILEQEIINDKPLGDIDWEHMESVEQQGKRDFLVKAEILIVDDNETNLKVTSGLLKKYGIMAEVADNGYRAIDRVLRHSYDLIFMDHMMPGMDGVETMQRIKEMDGGRYKDIPIVALTANAIAGVKDEMIQAGFQDYISKPIDILKLEQVLIRNLKEDMITYVDHMDDVLMMQEDNRGLESVLLHFDVEKGILNCGGMIEDYMQILEVVLKHGQARMDRLNKMMLDKDYENYTIDVHALKSTAANIGTLELSKAALEHEMAGKEKRFAYQTEHYQELLAQYAEVLKEIAEALQEQIDIAPIETVSRKAVSSQEEVKVEKEHIEVETLQDLLKSEKRFMDEFDMDKAETILCELEHFDLDAELAESITVTVQMIKNLDMAAAMDSMEAILKKLE